MVKDGYFTELIDKKSLCYSFKFKEILHEEQTKYQKIQVFDTYTVGKLLTLDDKTMVSEKDEFVYHEVISHIPAMVHRNTKRVLVIGGGDGGVVREFAKYKEIEEIHLVEIDERVIEVSKKYFPQCACALDDPRVKIFATDGIQFVKDHKNYYDIITVDSTDPEDFAAGLFTPDFYQSVHDALTEEGIMTAQTENPFLDEYGIPRIYENIQKAFPVVDSYWAPLLIYPGVFWTFAFASKKYKATDLAANKIDEMKKRQESLKWYNLDWHKYAAFTPSNFVKRKMDLKK